MAKSIVKAIKLVALALVFVSGIVSCEGDIEDVGVGIVDNGLFETNNHVSNLKAYNQNDLEVKANKLGQYLLGVYKNDDFGSLDASIVGQAAFLSSINFGTDPAIDSVVLNIPYLATKQAENNEDGSPKWELDSIWGDQSTEYTLSVYELNTYLNTLDPENPGEELDYYSDQTYLFKPTALYSGAFKPNKNDTMTIIQRREIIIDEDTMEHDVDTIKETNSAPSIKLPLNTQFFEDNFLTNPEAFENQAAFIEFFNGLYLQASKINPTDDTSIMTLEFYRSKMTIYYTNTVGEDRTKQTANFYFNNVNNNTYIRDYTDSKAKPFLDAPNTVDGDTRLFLNGAAGSIALVDLFVDEDLDEIRSNNWLINEANLLLYLDESADLSILPERLFLYNYEDETQIADVVLGSEIFGGYLERDEDGNPWRYKMKLTNFVSRILNEDDPTELKQLAIKVMNASDIPNELLDLKVNDYSWTPKGIIVHGSNSENAEKRLKLELVYSEKK